jgi:hypothetical protein
MVQLGRTNEEKKKKIYNKEDTRGQMKRVGSRSNNTWDPENMGFNCAVVNTDKCKHWRSAV